MMTDEEVRRLRASILARQLDALIGSLPASGSESSGLRDLLLKGSHSEVLRLTSSFSTPTADDLPPF